MWLIVKEMKVFIFAFLAIFVVSIFAETETSEPVIDWSKVIPVQSRPGFWDGREIRPAYYPGNVRTGRIVGGNIVVPNSHAYQAVLLVVWLGNTLLCGGSMISNRAILTSANCLSETTSTQVILGAHQFTAVEPTQHRVTVTSSAYRIHPDYNPNNMNNDIATLILPAHVGFTPEIQPLNLAIETAGSFAGELATVTGWGRTSDESAANSPQLQYAQNNVITNADCWSFYAAIVIPSTICISNTGGRGICNGDSGSPLTVGGSGFRTQIGVASFWSTVGCAVGAPSAFARVSSFRTWINSNMIP